MVLPDDGPADFLRRGLRRRRGVLTVGIKTEFGGEKRRLELTCTAPPTSFSEPLYCPTREGFSNSPGSRESFSSTVRVKAEADGEVVDERTFEGACLESLEGHNYPRGSVYLGEASSFLRDEHRI